MADDNQGVKPETEVDETPEEVNPDADSATDEKETQSDSSTDDKPDETGAEESSFEEESESEPVVASPKVPKPVEGETPKEYALRKEAERLRGKLREKRTQELFSKTERTVGDIPRESEQKQRPAKLVELEKKFKPDELQNFREVLEVYADDLGLVRKDALQATTYQQTATDVLDNFVEKHPEYLPENDTDDLLWKQFQEEFSYYKRPDDPKKLTKIFDRIHKSIVGDKPRESREQIAAQNQKIKSASHSASQGSGRGESLHPQGGGLNPALKEYLHGDFSDLDI